MLRVLAVLGIRPVDLLFIALLSALASGWYWLTAALVVSIIIALIALSMEGR